MPNTYTQIHLQIIFAPKCRQALLAPTWDNELQKFITGMVQARNNKLLCINNVPDHMHMLIGLNPEQSLSKLMQEVKAGSTRWINKNGFVRGRFEWQTGYGAFSYSKSQLPRVVDYIMNQQQHHAKTTFLAEYRKLLTEFEIAYHDDYLFTEPA